VPPHRSQTISVCGTSQDKEHNASCSRSEEGSKIRTSRMSYVASCPEAELHPIIVVDHCRDGQCESRYAESASQLARFTRVWRNNTARTVRCIQMSHTVISVECDTQNCSSTDISERFQHNSSKTIYCSFVETITVSNSLYSVRVQSKQWGIKGSSKPCGGGRGVLWVRRGAHKCTEW